MKKIIVLILSFMLISPIFTQDEDLEKYLKRREGVKYPNILKINTLAIVFNNVSLIYERTLIPRLSLNLAAGYKYGGDLPELFSNDLPNLDIRMGEITGYSFTPELRYYLKTCDIAYLDGFYAGLYFRYTKYNNNAEFDYYPENTENFEYYTAGLSMDELGVGISLGYQFILWERLSVDFLFFGPRYSNNHIGYEFNQPASQEFLDDLSNHINEVLDRYGFDYNVELKQDGEARASTSFSFANVRFGLSVGFAF